MDPNPGPKTAITINATGSGNDWSGTDPAIPTSGDTEYTVQFILQAPSGSDFPAPATPSLAGSSATTNGNTYTFDGGQLPILVLSAGPTQVTVPMNTFKPSGGFGSTMTVTIQLTYGGKP